MFLRLLKQSIICLLTNNLQVIYHPPVPELSIIFTFYFHRKKSKRIPLKYATIVHTERISKPVIGLFRSTVECREQACFIVFWGKPYDYCTVAILSETRRNLQLPKDR